MAAIGTKLDLGAADAPAGNLRVSVLSDIHCHHPAAVSYFERALKIFREASAHPQLRVSFPPITTKTSPTRAFDFSVKCEHLTGNVVTCEKECRVYSPNFCSAESRDTAPCACNFNYAALPRNCRGRIRFVVTPFDSWGNAGRPIVSEWLQPEKIASAGTGSAS